jgi:predicted RNA-binding Zn-ribbon protein involved in translation (DUF1610 family)
MALPDSGDPRKALRPPSGGLDNYIESRELTFLGLGHRWTQALGGTVQETRRRATGAFPLRSTGTIDSFGARRDALAMAAFFGPSPQDLERLRSTVQSLGTTSVPGLAAALSWRERKAQKVLAHELGRPGTPVVYDPGRRTVRWARALPDLPASPAPPAAPAAPSTTPRLPSAPGPVMTPAGLKTLCPSCRVPLQATGTASLAVCPSCGRLSSIRTGTTPSTGVPAPPPTRSAPPSTTTATTAGDAPSPLSDRRSQELFAAWVNAQPIPCPKCRTPLRHRGLSEYACPACGQMVRFPTVAPAGPTPLTAVGSSP